MDRQLLTKSSSAPLLDNTCIHFITVILSTRGLDNGKDSFPVFFVAQNDTLAKTIAKLVATTAHRYASQIITEMNFLLLEFSAKNYVCSQVDKIIECGLLFLRRRRLLHHSPRLHLRPLLLFRPINWDILLRL